MASCKAQHRVGNCGSNPIPIPILSANGSRSVFSPLLAEAAIGAIGGYLLSKNLAPKGAYVPPTDWRRNRPAVSGPLNPVIGSAINTGKATGNSPSPTSSFADLNKAKPGVYQTGQLKVNGSDTTGSTQLGCPRREENQPPFRTAQQRQTLSNNLRQPRTPHNDPRPVATTPAVTSSQERRRAPTRRLADPPVGNSERSPRAASWSGRPHRANVLQLSNAHTVRRASSWIATRGHRLSKARSTEATDFDHRIQRRR